MPNSKILTSSEVHSRQREEGGGEYHTVKDMKDTRHRKTQSEYNEHANRKEKVDKG